MNIEDMKNNIKEHLRTCDAFNFSIAFVSNIIDIIDEDSMNDKDKVKNIDALVSALVEGDQVARE